MRFLGVDEERKRIEKYVKGLQILIFKHFFLISCYIPV